MRKYWPGGRQPGRVQVGGTPQEHMPSLIVCSCDFVVVLG